MSRSSLALLGIGALLIGGCAVREQGAVSVDRPEVFSRERLVVRRHKEVSRLEEKLSAKQLAPTGMQGIRDFREFSAGLRGIGVHVSPQESKVFEEALDLQREKLRRQKGPGTAGQVTTKAAPPQPGISQSQAASAAPPVAGAAQTAQVQITGIERIQDEEAVRSYLQAILREKELDDTHDLLGLTIYTLKFDITLQPGPRDDGIYQVRLALTGGKAVRERLFFDRWIESFERAINSEVLGLQRRWTQGAVSDEERIELALQASRELQRVQGELASLDSSIHQVRNLVMENSFRFSSVKDAQATARERPAGAARSDTLEALASRLQGISVERENLGAQLEREQARRGTLVRRAELFRSVTRPGVDGGAAMNSPELREALARLVLGKYREQIQRNPLGLDRILSFQEDPVAVSGAKAAGETLYLVGVENRIDKRQREFADILKRLREVGDRLPHYAYSVEPKEYAQNISDVAARERLKDMAASLAAILPKAGGDLGFLDRQMRRSQSRIQAIKRKPLVVGYIDSEREFGWYLGPKFAIDGRGRVRFRHEHVQYSFQASIVVPAWWSKIRLKGEVVKETKRGARRRLGPLWEDRETGEDGIEVLLPGDPAAFTGWVLHQTERRPPYIVPPAGSTRGEKIGVRVGAPASVLLRGRDLWRNPQVFIGAQRADRTEILPDMGGLLARFDRVETLTPAAPGDREVLVDLSVVTSNGMSTLQDAVRVLLEP